MIWVRIVSEGQRTHLICFTEEQMGGKKTQKRCHCFSASSVSGADDVLDSVGVQGGVQVVKTLHSLGRLQVVRNHVLGKDPLHE